MLTGRKLLLADDSIAIQKVVDLTFTDEGMEVTTVGDGDQARQRLEEIAPDIVLADAHMPGIDGYELCRIIRQTERLKEIPVILLVSSFEPFNEADARQAGASDVVTKPFQSIRDLVRRVGSLLGNRSENAGAANKYTTLGLGRTDEQEPTASVDDQTTEPNLKVFVEAPSSDNESMSDTNVNVLVEAASMPEHEPADSAGASCATDVELQTADTRQLERIDDEDISPSSEPLYAQDDTIEIEPVMSVEKDMKSYSAVATVTGKPLLEDEVKSATQPATPPESADVFSDALLELGEFDNAAGRATGEDVILDLDFEEPLRVSDTRQESVAGSASIAATGVVTQLPSEAQPAEIAVVEAAPEAKSPVAPELRAEPQTEIQESGVVSETSTEAAAPITISEAEAAAPTAQTANVSDLWPETVDAIARRMVEQMSERIVREIVWEVVPELAELLIKQKLDEKK